MLLTQLVLQYEIKCNTNTVIVILSRQKKYCKITYGALIGNCRKVSFTLGMYVLLNKIALFISSK